MLSFLGHLEGLSCAPHCNSVPGGEEFFIKRPRILYCFWENSVVLYTVVLYVTLLCPPPQRIMWVHTEFRCIVYILIYIIIKYVLTYSIQAHLR
jgi:hypothetical protein